MIRKIETSKAPQPKSLPYSQAIVSGSFVFTAGQIPVTAEGKKIDGTIEEQMTQIMTNLKSILEAAGTNLSNVVKTTIYVTDMELYPRVNDAYASYMTQPYPARETVCVKALPLGVQIEISMVAVIP